MSMLEDLVNKYPELRVCLHDIVSSYELIKKAYEEGHKVLICGNGGSAADSEHIVGELMKGFQVDRPLPLPLKQKILQLYPDIGEYMVQNLQAALPAISLTSQTALITAIMNDLSPEMVYAQQVVGYGQSGDVIIGISTSGNSLNVMNAFRVARALGVRTIALTGESGGKLKSVSDISICVPFRGVVEIQERHLPIIHTLCLMLERYFFT